MTCNFSVILASTLDGVIGDSTTNDLPWRLKTDLKRFRTLTEGGILIMGRNTATSLPNGPVLPGNRHSIVITSRPMELRDERLHYALSLNDALSLARIIKPRHSTSGVWVVGGKRLYEAAFVSPFCNKIYWTKILHPMEGDNLIRLDSPCPNPHDWKLVNCSGTIYHQDTMFYQFYDYERQHEEYQYLRLVKEILNNGNCKGDRTGTGTMSVFGRQMKFSLRNNSLPLLTTKSVFVRGVIEELLWLVRGCTDSKQLAAKKVHIWDDNGSREFLDKLAMQAEKVGDAAVAAEFRTREVGDLGPLYGHQWRHWGADYINCSTDYSGQGIDQIAQVIETIKNNPNDRRIIISAWNVTDMKRMNLPACHCFSQFYVANGELNCHLYQRSADTALGIPFNIASYAILTAMIAKVTGLVPGEFIHSLGDTHLYNNHLSAMREQVTREPRPFPKLEIVGDIETIDDFKIEHFIITDYKPHGKLAMKMAV